MSFKIDSISTFPAVQRVHSVALLTRKEKNDAKIYKFQDCNYFTIRNFEKDMISLNNPSTFNDPFDSCKMAITDDDLVNVVMNHVLIKGTVITEGTRTAFRQLIDGGDAYRKINEYLSATVGENELTKYCKSIFGLLQDNVNLIKELIRKYFCQSYRVSCFSNNKDNILMWSHYSNSCKGFCLEYDICDVKKDIDWIFPCVYTDQVIPVQSQYLFELIDYYKKFAEDDFTVNFDITMIDNIMENMVRVAFIKEKSWEYEGEWRLIIPMHFFESNPVTYIDNKNTVLIPFVRPKAVYTGLKTSETHKEHIKEIVARKNAENELPAIQLYNLHLDHDNRIVENRIL